jgi:hypothetical protein
MLYNANITAFTYYFENKYSKMYFNFANEIRPGNNINTKSKHHEQKHSGLKRENSHVRIDKLSRENCSVFT